MFCLGRLLTDDPPVRTCVAIALRALAGMAGTAIPHRPSFHKAVIRL